MRSTYFQDRTDAGRWLAEKLTQYAVCPDLLVLGIAPGGVPVAFEIARALHASLDVLSVRSLCIPGDQKLSLGALAGNGMLQLDRALLEALAVSQPIIERFITREQQKLAHCEQLYHTHRLAYEAPGAPFCW